MHSLLFLLFILFLTASSATTHITSPSGLHQIPVGVLRRHFPSHETHPTHLLYRYLYEHRSSTNHLLTHHGHFDINRLTKRIVRSPPARRYLVNGRILKPPHAYGSIVRVATHQIFIHHYNGHLLGGWGVNLTLKPLDFAIHPTLFVNIHSEKHETAHQSIHSIPISVKQFEYQNDTGHFRPNWQSERAQFFDVGFAFDSSFCSVYASDASSATSYVHGVGVSAHQMTLTQMVSLRIGDIVGFCRTTPPSPSAIPVTNNNQTATAINDDDLGLTTENVNNDYFRPPSKGEMQNCLANTDCSIPGLRLEVFRKRWNAYINNSLSDAVYLLTEAKSIVKDDIVGAAWVASACSDFGFGWVLGDFPVIIAHEIGHTLGAPHSGEGLMRSKLPLDAPAKYDAKSMAAVESFIDRLSSQSCLEPRTKGKDDERRFTGFTRIIKPNPLGGIIEGTDLAIGKVRVHGEAPVIMLQVQRYNNGGIGAEMRMTTLFRTAEKGFPFSYNNTYFKRYVRSSHNLNFNAGAGIAIASIRNESFDDVICVMLNKNNNKMYYIIGYKIDQYHPRVIRDGWSGVKFIEPPLQNKILAIGAAAGDMRGIGQNDLVITYIEHNVNESTILPKYIIGYDIDKSTGVPRNGWSKPVDIKLPPYLRLPTNPTNIGDISVAFWEVPSLNESIPSSTHLLFAMTWKNPAVGWRTSACVARNAQKFKKWRSFPWRFNCYIPRVKTIYPKRLTGGIALTRLLSSTSPVATSVIYQNRHFNTGASSQWLDVGQGVLTRQRAVDPAQPKQLVLSVGEDIIPSDTCARCYTANHVKKCLARVESCFFQRQFGKLEKVRSVRISTTRQQISNTPIYFKPKSQAIFCAGFHSIFVVQQHSGVNTNGKCGWDAKRMSIVAEGIRTILLNEMTPAQTDIDGSANVTQGEIPEDLKYILGAGGFGENSVPTTIKVTVFSKKYIRWKLINQALAKLQKKPDWSSVYDVNRKDTIVKRIKGNRFLVTVALSNEIQQAWLTDIESGKNHDSRR